tara:strand:- start:312 stop:488 length:177 start_codon:yes stop_codon:yes gene_type:complete
MLKPYFGWHTVKTVDDDYDLANGPRNRVHNSTYRPLRLWDETEAIPEISREDSHDEDE